LANPEKRDGKKHWVPDNFPTLFGDKHLILVDGLIMRLISARNDLDDPAAGPKARFLIDRIVQAFGEFDPDSTLARHELIVRALDHSARLVTAPVVRAAGAAAGPSPFADLEVRTFSAEAMIRGALPSLSLPRGILRQAVELWPDTKHREARTRAVRDLARALECDVPSLLPMLRQARKRLREGKTAARAKKRTT
jgi:hypothetical protein